MSQPKLAVVLDVTSKLTRASRVVFGASGVYLAVHPFHLEAEPDGVLSRLLERVGRRPCKQVNPQPPPLPECPLLCLQTDEDGVDSDDEATHDPNIHVDDSEVREASVRLISCLLGCLVACSLACLLACLPACLIA